MDMRQRRCSSTPNVKLSDALEDDLTKNQISPSKPQNPVIELLKLSQTTLVDDWLPQQNAEFEPITPWASPQCQPSLCLKRAVRKKNSYIPPEKRSYPDFNTGIWNGSVEQYSYCYVSNNSCYRSVKLQTALIKANPSRRRPAIPTILGAEQRKLQRELTRELRKEFQNLLDSSNDSYFKIRDSVVEAEGDGEEEPDKPMFQRDVGDQSSNDHIHVPLADVNRGFESKSAQLLTDTLSGVLDEHRPKSSFERQPMSLGTRAEKVPKDPKFTDGEKQQRKKIQRRILGLDKQGKSNTVSHATPSTERVEALAKQTFNISKLDSNQSGNGRALRSLVLLSRSDHSHENPHENATHGGPVCTDIMARGIFSNDFIHEGVRQKTSFSAAFPGQSFENVAFKIPSLGQPVSKIVSKISETKTKLSQPSNNFMELESPVDEDLQSFLPSICGKGITTRLGSLQ